MENPRVRLPCWRRLRIWRSAEPRAFMPDDISNPAPPSRASTPSPPPATPSTRGTVLKIAGGVVGGIIGYTTVKLLPHDVAIRIFAGGAAGLLVGLIPFFIGRRRHPCLARTSLWLCLAAGLILGLLLALPVAVVFACIILAKKVDALPDA